MHVLHLLPTHYGLENRLRHVLAADCRVYRLELLQKLRTANKLYFQIGFALRDQLPIVLH
jgi:hypothetical protein